MPRNSVIRRALRRGLHSGGRIGDISGGVPARVSVTPGGRGGRTTAEIIRRVAKRPGAGIETRAAAIAAERVEKRKAEARRQKEVLKQQEGLVKLARRVGLKASINKRGQVVIKENGKVSTIAMGEKGVIELIERGKTAGTAKFDPTRLRNLITSQARRKKPEKMIIGDETIADFPGKILPPSRFEESPAYALQQKIDMTTEARLREFQETRRFTSDTIQAKRAMVAAGLGYAGLTTLSGLTFPVRHPVQFVKGFVGLGAAEVSSISATTFTPTKRGMGKYVGYLGRVDVAPSRGKRFIGGVITDIALAPKRAFFETVGTLGFFKLVGMGGRAVKYKLTEPKIISADLNQLVTKQLRYGADTIARGSIKVKVGKNIYDIKSAGFEVGRDIEGIGTQKVLGNFYFYGKGVEAVQITKGMRFVDSGVAKSILTFKTTFFKGIKKVGKEAGIFKIQQKKIVDVGGLSRYFIKAGGYTYKAKGTRLSFVEAGILKETARVDSFTFGKSLTKGIKVRTDILKDFSVLKKGAVMMPKRTVSYKSTGLKSFRVESTGVSASAVTQMRGGALSVAKRLFKLDIRKAGKITGLKTIGVTIGALGLRQKQRARQTTIRTPKIRLGAKQGGKVVSIPKIGAISKYATKEISITFTGTKQIIQPKATQKQRLRTIQIPKSSPYSSQKTRGVTVPKPTIPISPKVPLPSLNFNLGIPKKKKKKRRKSFLPSGRTFKYAASIEASAFNIRGAMPKRITGLGLRPIVRF